jgi:hypothetical protein
MSSPTTVTESLAPAADVSVDCGRVLRSVSLSPDAVITKGDGEHGDGQGLGRHAWGVTFVSSVPDLGPPPRRIARGQPVGGGGWRSGGGLVADKRAVDDVADGPLGFLGGLGF